MALSKQEIEWADSIIRAVLLQKKIIAVLEKHPNGLKAREIAELIPNTDKKSINQMLYANYPDIFQVDNYIWKLKKQDIQPIHKKAVSTVKNNSSKKKKEFDITGELFRLEKYCEVASLSKTVKKTIYAMNKEAYFDFIKNLKELYEDRFVRYLNGEPATWDCENNKFLVSVAMDSNDRIAEIKERAEKISVLIKENKDSTGILKASRSFYVWKKIINQTKKEFDVFLECFEMLSNHTIKVSWMYYSDWVNFVDKLSSLESTKDLIRHNNYINDNILCNKGTLGYSLWEKLVFLSDKKLSEFAEKYQILMGNKYVYSNVFTKISESDIFKLCTQTNSQFHNFLLVLPQISKIIDFYTYPSSIPICEYVSNKERVAEDYAKAIKEEKSIERINAISGDYDRIRDLQMKKTSKNKGDTEIKFCTGNCSICKRNPCPYE